MKHLVAAWLIFLLAVSAGTPAFAHRPYYTQVEKILLPNGEIGEVRLLNGDGILGPDPVRPIVVDGRGRLIARGPKGRSMAVSCSEPQFCSIVNLWKILVLELDAATFRDGPQQPPVAMWERTDDWELEDGDDHWGFTTREATLPEFVDANIVLIKTYLGGLMLLALFAALGVLPLMLARSSDHTGWQRHVANAVRTFVRLTTLGIAMCVTLYMALIGGLTIQIWLLFFIVGVGFAWGGVRGVRRIRSMVAAASDRKRVA